MQTIEERLDQLERSNRRLTAALAVMAVAICAVVTMAATEVVQGDLTRDNMDLTNYLQIEMDMLKADHIRSQACVVMSN